MHEIEIRKIIERSRMGEERLLLDSAKAARDIMAYLLEARALMVDVPKLNAPPDYVVKKWWE